MRLALLSNLSAFAPSLQTANVNLSLLVFRIFFELSACSEALAVDFSLCETRLKTPQVFDPEQTEQGQAIGRLHRALE